MHENNLNSFPRGVLYGKPKLRDIDFSGNEISRVGDADTNMDDLFKSSYLSKIDLRGNLGLAPFMNLAFVGENSEEATRNGFVFWNLFFLIIFLGKQRTHSMNYQG